MSSNTKLITQKERHKNSIKNNTQQNQKRLEIEKELNIQRNHRDSGKMPNITQMQMNHLNYYNEIAKQNTRYIMNNPSFKEVARITSDESCLDQIKQKLKSKDLPKLLDHLPLIRVERINYKTKEIGHMRRDLAKYSQKNKYVYIDQKKGKEFASNIFTRRLKEGGKYVPVKSIDNLYNTEKNNKISKTPIKSNSNMKNKLTTNKSYNDIWTRKYKRLNNMLISKENEEKKNDENNKENNKVNNNENNNENNKENKKENNINNNRLINQKNLTISEKDIRRRYIRDNKNNQINHKRNITSIIESSNLNLKNSNKIYYNNIKEQRRSIQLDRRNKEEFNDLRHNSVFLSINKFNPKKEERTKINVRKRLGERDKNLNEKYIGNNTNNNNHQGFYSKVRRRFNVGEKMKTEI